MRKAFIRAIVLLVLTVIALICILSVYDYAFGETFYVLCKPDGEVNVRERAKLKSPIVGCVFFADRIETDGKEENGFVHVVNLNAESDSGWIYKGLLSEDKPVKTTGQAQVFGSEKVAARKYAGGKVKKWLHEGQNVELYAISEDWCVTEYGYVMTQFLTVNAPVRGS